MLLLLVIFGLAISYVQLLVGHLLSQMPRASHVFLSLVRSLLLDVQQSGTYWRCLKCTAESDVGLQYELDYVARSGTLSVEKV